VERLGKILEPIPIVEPNRTINSWFVAVQVRDRLVGYMQLTPDLTLRRYASFWRGERDFENCPDSGSWLDLSRIRETAGAIAKPSESLGEPFLTYHRHPTRIAWGIEAKDERDKKSIIFVAGDFAFRGDENNGQITLGQ
jgi:hypothetical protein